MISGNILVIGGKTSLTFFLADISDDIEECVLFGFPGNSNDILKLNFCILYAKYYIYIKKLSNSNKIDFLNFLTYLKQKINIKKPNVLNWVKEWSFWELLFVVRSSLMV